MPVHLPVAAAVSLLLLALLAFAQVVVASQVACQAEPVIVYLDRGQKVTVRYWVGEEAYHEVRDLPKPNRQPIGANRHPVSGNRHPSRRPTTTPYPYTASSSSPKPFTNEIISDTSKEHVFENEPETRLPVSELSTSPDEISTHFPGTVPSTVLTPEDDVSTPSTLLLSTVPSATDHTSSESSTREASTDAPSTLTVPPSSFSTQANNQDDPATVEEKSESISTPNAEINTIPTSSPSANDDENALQNFSSPAREITTNVETLITTTDAVSDKLTDADQDIDTTVRTEILSDESSKSNDSDVTHEIVLTPLDDFLINTKESTDAEPEINDTNETVNALLKTNQDNNNTIVSIKSDNETGAFPNNDNETTLILSTEANDNSILSSLSSFLLSIYSTQLPQTSDNELNLTDEVQNYTELKTIEENTSAGDTSEAIILTTETSLPSTQANRLNDAENVDTLQDHEIADTKNPEEINSRTANFEETTSEFSSPSYRIDLTSTTEKNEITETETTHSSTVLATDRTEIATETSQSKEEITSSISGFDETSPTTVFAVSKEPADQGAVAADYDNLEEEDDEEVKDNEQDVSINDHENDDSQVETETTPSVPDNPITTASSPPFPNEVISDVTSSSQETEASSTIDNSTKPVLGLFSSDETLMESILHHFQQKEPTNDEETDEHEGEVGLDEEPPQTIKEFLEREEELDEGAEEDESTPEDQEVELEGLEVGHHEVVLPDDPLKDPPLPTTILEPVETAEDLQETSPTSSVRTESQPTVPQENPTTETETRDSETEVTKPTKGRLFPPRQRPLRHRVHQVSRNTREARNANTNVIRCSWTFRTEPGVPLLLTLKNYSAVESERCVEHHVAVERSNGYEARWCGATNGTFNHATFARHEIRLRFYTETNETNPIDIPEGFVVEVQALDMNLLRKAVSKVRPLYKLPKTS